MIREFVFFLPFYTFPFLHLTDEKRRKGGRGRDIAIDFTTSRNGHKLVATLNLFLFRPFDVSPLMGKMVFVSRLLEYILF